MMPRAQIAALAVLLVSLGVVLVLVGDTGVSTGVFLPDHPTETATPTATSSPTPTPESYAGNWMESPDVPGQLSYVVDPNINAQIVYQTASYDEMINLIGLERPTDEDPYPLVTLLSGIRAELEGQVSEAQLTTEPDAFTGPVIEVIEGLPVTTLRVRIPTQTASGGIEFTGLDLTQMFVEHPDDQITFVQYVLRGESDPAVYADFRGWLKENIVKFVGESAAATPAATAPVGSTQTTPQDTTSETTTEAVSTPEALGEVTVTPAITLAVTPEATAEVMATPAATQEAAPTAAAEGTETGSTEPGEKWIEETPGQVIYVLNPSSAGILYTAAPLDEFAVDAGVEMTEGAPLPTIETIMRSMRKQIEADIEADGVIIEEDAFEGPIAETIGDVEFTYLRMTTQAQTTADGQEVFPRLVVLGMLQSGDNQITVIRFIYQGDPDPAVYADFREWLEQNIARLSTLEVMLTGGE